MSTLVKNKKYFLLFILIGVIVYFPIFFNGFVWDDMDFIIDNSEVHKLNLPSLLSHNMFNSGPFYRPIPAIYFASLYSLFGEQALFYHAIQLILHIVGTSFLFLFFRRIFTVSISFFLALLFLVHPINAESVAFIGSTQSELYFIPGITALLLAQKQNLSQLRFLSIIGLLFVSIMVKETGFLFVLLIILYRYLFKMNKIKQFIFSTAVIVTLYALLRVFLAEVKYKVIEHIPIASVSFADRILNIPAIIIYYLKTFLFPLQLAVWQIWVIKSFTFESLTIPLILSVSFFIALLLIAYYLYKRGTRQYLLEQTTKQMKHQKKQITEEQRPLPQFLFFLLWFVLGLGLLLQLVPLDMTVADRWFYFPIVGLLGIIGVGIQTLPGSYKHYYKLSIGVAVIVLSLLAFRTFVRTFDYKDNITLYTHDLKEQKDNRFIIANLADNLFAGGRIDEAIYYQKLNVALFPQVGYLNELGISYQAKKQYKEAIASFTSAVNLPKIKQFQYRGDKNIGPYANLAYTLLLDKRPYEAISFLNNQALKEFPNNPDLLTLLAISESQVNNHENAFKAITEAYKVSQDENITSVYNRIRNNMTIIIGGE